MKHIFFIFLSISFFSPALCQKQIKIVDSLTGKGLPFATVECFTKSWGLYSDSVGNVIISENMLKETCKVSFVGYQSKEVVLENIGIVLLTRLPQRLEDVTVVSCKETVVEKLEVEEAKRQYSLGFSASSTGCIWSIYVPNTLGKQGKISTVTYKAMGANSAKVEAPIRIRFFEYDSIAKMPRDELSIENIIISPKKLKKDVTEDLAKYNIRIPENGIVVAFEMLYTGPEYKYKVKTHFIDGTTKMVEHYGWMINGTYGKDILGFMRSVGSTWVKAVMPNSRENSFGPAVKLEIKVCK